MASKLTPSVFRIIQVDYGATLGFVFVIAPVGAMICVLTTNSEDAINFLLDDVNKFIFAIFLIVMLGAGLIVYWRIKTIRSLFNNGIEVPGVIDQVMATNKRYVNNVGCTYTFDNRMHRSVYTISNSKHTRFLEPGEKITMVVDPDNPERALIMEVYI